MLQKESNMTTAQANTLPFVTAQSTKMAVNKDAPIEYVHVVVGHKDKDGTRHEVVHKVDGTDVAISKFNLSHEQKFAKVKNEEGLPLGFEPTGEEVLTVTVKYIKAP
jgi:hypothetical protein